MKANFFDEYMEMLPELYQQNFLKTVCKWRNNNNVEKYGIICLDILSSRIWHRHRSIVLPPRCKIGDGCAKWVGILCLTTDKRWSETD